MGQALWRSAPREVEDRSVLQHPDLQKLFDLWRSRVRGGEVAREDIDVLELGPWMGWLILVEAVGGELICRVHGTFLTQRFGYDMTGKSLRQHLRAGHRDRAMEEYWCVARTGRPLAVTLTLTLEEIDRTGRTAWEKLMLPLRKGGSELHQVLAGFYPLPASCS